MRPGITGGLLFSLVLALTVTAHAQSWTPEQEDVWADTEKSLQLYFSGDLEAHYEYVHPDVIWWNTRNAFPGNLDEARALDTVYLEHEGPWLVAVCTPLTIQAFDTFAVVNTYCRGQRKDSATGSLLYTTQRWLNVMKREGDKWVLVANYGDGTSG